MATPPRIQTLSLGSQTLSTASFAVQMNGTIALEGFHFETVPGDPTAEAGRITQLSHSLEALAEASDKKAPTRYALSGQAVFTRFLKLPPLAGGKVEQLVEFEAQQNVPFPINEVEWDYMVMESPGGDAEVAIVAIKDDALNQTNDLVEEAGFTVEAVDVAPMALVNALRYNYPEVAEPIMLIDIGSRCTNLVFTEPGRIFTRTLPIGGASVTSAIAKDFKIAFKEAEEQKIAHGFVALGGNYAEHPDPTLAAIARLARTAMTRLHAEIVRSINYYRGTMGGGQPAHVLLSGGGAAMPYTKEFFEEKLGIHVDYFNAVRRIGLPPSVAESAPSAAFRLGEHVGLALRHIGSCPVEIDLEPDDVAARRVLASRKPWLTSAAAALILGFVSWAGFAHFAAAKAGSRASEISAEYENINEIAREISGHFRTLEAIGKTREPLEFAIETRAAWPRFLDFLNRKFASDILWITEVAPLPNTVAEEAQRTVSGEIVWNPAAARPTPRAEAADGEPQGPPMIDTIRLRGLWRARPNAPNAGQDEVRRIYKDLAESAESPFDGERMTNQQGRRLVIQNPDDETYAWPFMVLLPLETPVPMP